MAVPMKRKRWIFVLLALLTIFLLNSLRESSQSTPHLARSVAIPVNESPPPHPLPPARPFSPVTASILAGAFTGIIETLLMYPLENLKTQQQLVSKPILELFKRTVHAFGLLGLYRGMLPILVGAIPTQAIRWGSYEFVCSLRGCHTILDVFVSGLISGCFVAIATGIPMESMKTHMIHTLHVTPSQSPTMSPQPQAQLIQIAAGSSPTSTSEFTFVNIRGGGGGHQRAMSGSGSGSGIPPFASSSTTMLPASSASSPTTTATSSPSFPSSLLLGFSSPLVFKGWAPTIFKKVLNQAIRFPVHSFFLRLFCQGVSCVGQHAVAKGFVAGSLAGLSSILITQPVDVIKTRMQGIGADRYGHSWRCAVTMLQEEGINVFFTGILPRSARVALGAGVTFSIFPIFKAFFASL